MKKIRPVLVLVMDGIGTSNTVTGTSGILDAAVDVVMNGLTDAKRYLVKWSASYGPVGGNGESWSRSADAGVIDATAAIAAHPEHDIVIMAYSGGNLIAKRLLEIDPETASRVVAVGRLSDPWRPRMRWQNGTPNPGGWGVCGEDQGPVSDRTYWTSAPAISQWLNPPDKRNGRVIPAHVLADPISSCSDRSLLRPFAAGTDYLGNDPNAFFKDVTDLTKKSNAQILFELTLMRQNPLAYFLGLNSRLDVTFQEALSYSMWRQHTTAYIEPFKTSDGDMRSLSQRLGGTVLVKTLKRSPR